MRTLVLVGALAALLLCGAAAFPYETAPITAGGTITGVVRYAGVAPRRAQLEISKDKDVCGATPLFDQSLIVSSSGGIGNAVITITDIPKGEPMRPVNGVIFDQIGCEYSPHVIAFPAGSSIKVLNSDGILHSIHTESTINPVVDMAQPGFKKTLNVTIEKPEAIHVTCDAHNWMDGWWYATGNPYFAITGPDGRFSIANVPPGNYTLQVWQEKLGTMSRKVTVAAGQSVTTDFTMKPAKD